jgi:hypothetical protein
MMHTLTAKEILDDIEFEIAQSIISLEELRDGIEAVRQFQNNVRQKTFESLKITDPYREVLSRQFQVNDMLISVLQEMALSIQSMQLEIKNLRQLPSTILQVPRTVPHALKKDEVAPNEQLDLRETEYEIRSSDEIKNAMRPETIQVDLQARPIRWPVIGWLLTKLKIWYQRPALFYTQIFASRQAPVNQVLGDRILYLESYIQAQQGQIEALKSQLESPTD